MGRPKLILTEERVLLLKQQRAAANKRWRAKVNFNEYRKPNRHRYDATEHGKKKRTSYALQGKYKIDLEKYEAMLTAQGGVCVICLRKPEEVNSKRRFAVDHDKSHCYGKKTCGKCIRGVLCVNCNTAIGQLQHDPTIIKRAASYLEAPCQYLVSNN